MSDLSSGPRLECAGRGRRRPRWQWAVADGRLPIAVHHVYDGLEQVSQAHRDMENNTATGKLVVRVRH